jgi:hypothetical protein
MPPEFELHPGWGAKSELYANNGGKPRESRTSKNITPQPHAVFEVAEAVGDPADGLHLVVEAFGDSIVVGKFLHGDNLGSPAVKGIAELHQGRQPDVLHRPR